MAITGMPSLFASGDGDVLLLRVDHEERVRQLLHVADALEVLRHLLPLALEPQLLFLVSGLFSSRAGPRSP
jgi:hypothetical protein